MSQASASSTSGVQFGTGAGSIGQGNNTGLYLALIAAAVLAFWLFNRKK